MASASVSPSKSPSASLSPSASISGSPSASPSPIVGSVCWGHVTGVTEANVRTFTGNWTGTGTISGAGDAENVRLDPGEYLISEVVYTGSGMIELDQNHYTTGGDAIISYRTALEYADLLTEEWAGYSAPFNSLGYVQARLDHSGGIFIVGVGIVGTSRIGG